ncbi:hypothetical protein [Oceanobacillus senegalensis]|uniref:hypothetical protein n=1 Tax=Oceanobacillus senegalensis TaxID=1936063 RepID=UPI000A30FCC8|nr:hypothetical protein [Oceanobacillus senegalensis]
MVQYYSLKRRRQSEPSEHHHHHYKEQNDFKHQHRKHHHCKHDCMEELSELIRSVANMENALAEAIEAEILILKYGNFKPEEVKEFHDRLENLIKLAIKKEIILEFLIDDTTKACKEIRTKDDHKCKKCSPHPCNCPD